MLLLYKQGIYLLRGVDLVLSEFIDWLDNSWWNNPVYYSTFEICPVIMMTIAMNVHSSAPSGYSVLTVDPEPII